MTAELENCGVIMLDDSGQCPWKPDIIHGQHHEYAFRAILRFPATPAILYLHGFLPALEKPFRHPRILRYLTIAEVISQHWSSTYGLPTERFQTILNHIDLDRFPQKTVLADKPSKALIFSNATFSQEQFKVLQNVCTDRGITLALAGLSNGPNGMLLRPEDHLPQYDLVFAVGRSALEAAACGCGVIPVYQGMAEEILLPETYERLRKQNLAPRLSNHHKLSEEWISQQLGRWNSAQIMRASGMVRESTGLDKTILLLEKIYAEVCLEHSQFPNQSWEEESLALETYFASSRFVSLSREVEQLETKIQSMKNSLCWKLSSPLRWIDGVSGQRSRKNR